MMVGKLHLSIPWKNLYNEPVVIELDGFYAVVGPESGELKSWHVACL